jgi:hypothetical protein
MLLAGGIAAAALVSAAPAAAQYYPGYPGYGYGTGGVIGQIINGVTGNPGYAYGGNPGYAYGGNPGYAYGGYGGYGGNGANSQVVVGQCVNAVQARLGGGYNGYAAPYGYGAPNGYGGGRVLGISRVEPRSGGGVTVRGVATSGRNARYGYGYNGQAPVDLTFKCRTDYRGYVTDVDVAPAQTNYGYNYTPWNNDYSAYGYRRY